jgi:hypothetical protein
MDDDRHGGDDGLSLSGSGDMAIVPSAGVD